MPPHEYTPSDVARRTGLKPTQIEYLVKSGAITPEYQQSAGTGKHRRYSDGDLVQFSTARALLLATAMQVEQVGRILGTLREPGRHGFRRLRSDPTDRDLIVYAWLPPRGESLVNYGAQFMTAEEFTAFVAKGVKKNKVAPPDIVTCINMETVLAQLEADPDDDDPGKNDRPINEDEDDDVG